MMNPIPITIEYRKVKNINLYIKRPDGRILVTAPRSVSKKKIMEFVKAKELWIEDARARMQQAQEREQKEVSAVLTADQVSRLRYQVKRYAEQWEPVMGVHASGWTLRDMKTRWGSCTVKTGRIRINSRLAHYPEELLEYVVVHELCHLIEPSHNARFKQAMTSFLPDWRERKVKLTR